MNRPQRAARAVWLIAGLFALFVIAIAAWLLRDLEQRADAAACRQAESVARGAETALNRILLDTDLTLAGLERMPGLFDADGRVVDRAHAAALLRAFIEQHLLLHDLFLLDAGGAVVAAAREATARLGPDLPPAFFAGVAAQAAPQLGISAPVTDFGTGQKVVFLARPLGPQGAGRVVAVASVPVAVLSTVMAPSVELAGLSIALESDDGLLLASVPANDTQLGRRLAWPPRHDAGRAGAARWEPGRLGEPLACASARPTVYASVVVTAGVSAASAWAGWRGERTTTLAFAALFIGLAAVVAALAQTYLGRLARASAESLHTRQVLEEALASMDEGFMLWDADDRVVSWNARYLALFPHLRGVAARGVSFEQLARSAAPHVLPGADEATREAWVAERLAAHRAVGREFEQRLPGGRTVSTVERRTANGGTVSIYRDVSEARAAADELERARRAAEAANDAKTRFLATMSHEIRTPLNGVLGMNGLLLDTPLDARQRLYAETMRSSGEALLDIINDILDMSKLEAGRMALEPAPFDPAALVDEVVALLATRAAAKGIRLAVEHDGGGPALLEGDAGRIRQVLFNLVGNAVKFTERGGVTVRTQWRPCVDGRVDWMVQVHDTGIGIAPEAMAGLFQRFTQADGRITRQFGGSGLGLAISRELVELMGGRIEVDSRLGEGSEFRIALPLAPAGASADRALSTAGAPAPPPARGGALRVLVAEDNRVNQLLLSAMLTQLGHFADVVADGREALRQVQQVRYDLVLMDIQMPEMDGVSATRAIRALPGPAGRLPIIAVSANVLPEQQAAYRAAGMNDVVTKPIEQARLVAAIAGVVAMA